MEDFMANIRAKVGGVVCPIHDKTAGVKLKANEFDFKIQACCKKFKYEIYVLCDEEKLKYLKAEHNKLGYRG